MIDGYVPKDHPLITINLHRQGGKPCLKGTRLPAKDVSDAWMDGAFRSGSHTREMDGYSYVRATYGKEITNELIDAAIAWESDPERTRITRLALRRQMYGERRAG